MAVMLRVGAAMAFMLQAGAVTAAQLLRRMLRRRHRAAMAIMLRVSTAMPFMLQAHATTTAQLLRRRCCDGGSGCSGDVATTAQAAPAMVRRLRRASYEPVLRGRRSCCELVLPAFCGATGACYAGEVMCAAFCDEKKEGGEKTMLR